MVQLNTPVAFFIFNRPDLTQQVFHSIALARPKTLFVIADGPRSTSERALCEETRGIIEKIDWDCELFTNYSEENMQCFPRMRSGLSWVFSQVHEAIILEDDCLPHPSFFPYCQELLSRYRDAELVAQISGTNLTLDNRSPFSYRFSRMFPSWGWATWRRAWNYFDKEMSCWTDYSASDDLEYFGAQEAYVRNSFERASVGERGSWDTQWAFAGTVRGALSTIPRTNLIRNIGFRSDATHTNSDHWIAHLPVRGLRFPLEHPPNFTPDQLMDQKFLGLLSGEITFKYAVTQRIFNKIIRVMSNAAIKRQ